MENEFRHKPTEGKINSIEYPEDNALEDKESKKINKISSSEKSAYPSTTPELIRHLVGDQFINTEVESAGSSKNISEKVIVSEGLEKIKRKTTKEQKQNKIDSADTKIKFSNERLLELSSDLVFDGKSIETLINQKIISYKDLAKVLEARKSGADIEQLFSKLKKSPESPEVLLGQKSVATGIKTRQTPNFTKKSTDSRLNTPNPQPYSANQLRDSSPINNSSPKNHVHSKQPKPLSVFDVVIIIIFILIIIFAILSYS